MGSRRWGEKVLGCLSLLSSSPDLPFQRQWNLLQDGAPPALPLSAGAPAPAEEKTKVIMELEPTKTGSFKEGLFWYCSPGGFSRVHETSFDIQSCSYQAARGHHQPIFQVSAKILFGHQNDIAAMLESDKRQK